MAREGTLTLANRGRNDESLHVIWGGLNGETQ